MPSAPTSSLFRKPQLLLADQLFLAAHSPISAELRVSKDALALGLGGAMIGEALFDHQLVLPADTRQLLLSEEDNPHMRMPDYVGVALVQQVMNSPETTDVRTWLTYLATPNTQGAFAYTWIGDRLAAKKFVTCEIRRWFFRKYKAYLPVDAAQNAMTRVLRGMRERAVLNDADQLLVGLIFAIGMDVAFESVPVDHIEWYRDLIRRAPHPSIRCLITEVEAVVGDLVMRTHL